MRTLVYIAIGLLTSISVAQAQYITLDADKEVIWDSQAQKMSAIGNAVATKGDMKVKAAKMEAYYAKNDTTGKNTITEVHAYNNVVMTSPKANAYGDKLDYDVIKDELILTGKPTKLKTEKEEITATDNITYYPREQKAVALGDVHAIDQDKNQIYAQKMIAFFQKNDQGETVMDKVEIYDDVKIVTKDATVVADKGLYLPKIAVIKLFDNVLIDQQGNKLKGDFAETNLNTGKSRIIAGQTSQGRVSGIFKEKKKDK